MIKNNNDWKKQKKINNNKNLGLLQPIKNIYFWSYICYLLFSSFAMSPSVFTLLQTKKSNRLQSFFI